MTHTEILKDINTILSMESSTWQEKKDFLADYVMAWRQIMVIGLMDEIRRGKVTSSMTNKEAIELLEKKTYNITINH